MRATRPAAQIEQAAREAIATRDEQKAALWAMTHAERCAAMYAGRLSFHQCMCWARRYPDGPLSPPQLNGEWWFLAIKSADLDDD